MRRIAYQNEIVEYTGLSKWAIAELTRRKKIPYFTLPGIRRYLYDLDKIDEWIKSLQEDNKNLGT